MRLPEDFQFNVSEVEMFRRGDEVVLRRAPDSLAVAFELLASRPGDFMAEGRQDAPGSRARAGDGFGLCARPLIPVLTPAVEVGERYGAIRADREKAGMPIGNDELWVAAHARALGVHNRGRPNGRLRVVQPPCAWRLLPPAGPCEGV